MEEVTQSFCLAGETDIIEIPCDNVNGQNVVHWVDIEQIFPGVKYVKRGNIAVIFMKDPHLTKSIKHYPGVVLDVVLSTSDGNESTTVSRTNNNSTNATLQQQNLPSDDDGDDTKSTLTSNQIVRCVQKDILESNVEQLIVASPPSDSQSKTLTSSTPDALVQAIKGGNLGGLGEQLILCLQDLKNEVAKNNELASKNHELTAHVIKLQEEMKQLQIQALDRLALLQNNVRALLTQTYELHEYPIPRLFIVLPDNRSSWNPMDFFSNKFRLYFLCECGEHTKATNSKIPHHIHLAKHGGYDIASPKEFRQYGSYVLTILRMLKFGISIAGVVVPAVSLLVRDDMLHQATSSLKMLIGNISSGMDQVIHSIENISTNEDVVDGHSGLVENSERLEGADLRQLKTFLKNKDSNRVLGNLYRTVTSEGHVKWVCLDHFRENYHAKAAQSFRETVYSLHGTFDENIGRAEVTLRSRLQAEQFYRVLESAKSVYELKVELDWETTQSDFKDLRDTLAISNVGVLELHLRHQDIPARDILNRNQRFDPILDIMRHRAIQSFTLRGPQDLTKRSSLLSGNYDFPYLQHLDISLHQMKDDIPGLKCLISKATKLSTLAVAIDTRGRDSGYLLQAITAIEEHRACTINFKEWDLCLPPLSKGSNQAMAVQQCMEHLLGLYCATATTLDLSRNVPKLFWNTVESFRGSSDVEISRVEVILRSRVQAEHFYFALAKAGLVRDLRIKLGWEATQSDLEKLRDTLVASNVGALELYLMKHDGPTKDLPNHNQLYDPILDIMRCQSIKSFTIRGPRGFSKQSSLLSRSEGFPDLQHLDISLYELKDDIPGVTRLISNASNLSSLTVGTGTQTHSNRYDNDHVLQTYNAIAEHRTCPINFKEWDLCLPPPPLKESDESMAARQCLEHILKLYCETSSAPYFNRNGQTLIWNVIESLRVSSDEDIGRVEVKLRSSAQAEYFYFALAKARFVHEIKIELDWKVTQGDLEKLRDTLGTVNVGVLELHLNRESSRDLSSNGQLYDAILDIMRFRSIQSFAIRGPRDFSKQSSLLSRNYDFSHLQHLDISLHELQNDIPGVMCLISKTSNLSSLAVGTGVLFRQGDNRYVLEAYNAIAKHRTYPINFKHLNLVIPPPPRESNQSMATQQCMEYLLNLYCQNGNWGLEDHLRDEMTVDTLARAIATTNGSAFKKLNLLGHGRLNDLFIIHISIAVGLSKLSTILISIKDERCERIFESIQWKHLRELTIFLNPGTFETSVMRALVDGVTKMSEKVELDKFWFGCDEWGTRLNLPGGDLLQTFVASTSIWDLGLKVSMTLEQILSLLRSTDFSRLGRLDLWVKGFDSVKVDAILNGLQHATRLECLELRGTNITREQYKRMNARGVSLITERRDA
ncbi:MAG: hypothetical protein J3Q66DRAFT_440227 [Benniella sp.]|nr:MAG: hypothetical protein J3Q66DRAFT_440227 [Benniella sp.]